VTRRDVLATLGAAALAEKSRAADGADVALTVEDEDLYARVGGRPLLRYRRRTVPAPEGESPLLESSGYLHPVHAPCGVVVTNHLSPDHRHQRGIFSAWTKTRVTYEGDAIEPDFWNIHLGTGRTRSEGVTMLRSSGGRPAFRSRQVFEARWRERWVPMLDETWEVGFPVQRASDPGAPEASYLFDITVRQAPRHSIELPKYHYGGMGVRGSGQWPKGSDMTVLTSEGKDRAGADSAKARWIDMSGTVDGKLAGITLMEHPANLNAPNAVRMHPDMPYYVFALPQSGPVTLEAGREYVFRYRVVPHNGRADRARLDSLWAAFARG
jgi:hypothetical protein